MNIYLDISNTLILPGRRPAEYCEEFLKYVTENHTPFFLSSLCTEESQTSREYLGDIFPLELHRYVKEIPIAEWISRKTQGIDFGQKFIWIDDILQDVDKEELEKQGALANFVLIDHQRNPGQLQDIMKELGNH